MSGTEFPLPVELHVAIFDALEELPDLYCTRRVSKQWRAVLAAFSSRQLHRRLRSYESRWQHTIELFRRLRPGPGLAFPWQHRGPQRNSQVVLDVVIQPPEGGPPPLSRSFRLSEVLQDGHLLLPELTDYIGYGDQMENWHIECKLRREDTGEQCLLYRRLPDEAVGLHDATHRCEWDERDSLDTAGPERPYHLIPFGGPGPPDDILDQLAALPGDQICRVLKTIGDYTYEYTGPAKHYATAALDDLCVGSGVVTLSSLLPIAVDPMDFDNSHVLWPLRRELFCDRRDVELLEAFHDPQRDLDGPDLDLPDQGSDRFEVWVELTLAREAAPGGEPPDQCGPPGLSFCIMNQISPRGWMFRGVPKHELPALFSLVDWYTPMPEAEFEQLMEDARRRASAAVAAMLVAAGQA